MILDMEIKLKDLIDGLEKAVNLGLIDWDEAELIFRNSIGLEKKK